MVLRPFDETGVERDEAGIKRYVDLPDSVVAMLRASVHRDPDAEAVVEVDGPRLTYRQLWDGAARVAGGLRAGGVERGDRVAIRLGNGVDWVLGFLGALMAGGVAVPVNIRFTDDEARYVIEDSGSRLVLAPGRPLPQGEPYVEEGLRRDELAAIFYTSGTTGFPKGAMTSHENFLTNIENARRVVGLPREDPTLRNLISVPLFHVTGCNSQLLPTLQCGAAAVIMPTFEVGRFLRVIPEERIAIVTTVPAIFWLAINQAEFPRIDVSGVRYTTYGGAPIAPDLVQAIQRSFPEARVGNGFGLSETSSISTFLPHEYASTHADSVGFPAPVVDLDLADADPETGVGELLIRGAQVVQGYWNKPEATVQAFTDGWLHSGDLARIDDDGFVYIVDRAKDMINRGGENVYCVEVENVLAAAPGVFEVAVVGVPDQMMGEKVGAVVVPQPGIDFDVDEFLGFVRTRLADFKAPQYVVVRSAALPRNPGGKVLKPVLRTETEWGSPLR
ncbi:class I adenylate-forming enzyme family protein [Blastococcus saxobsidens]|uniref:Putative fatty-acid--CoA ligase n=1 Tax=Blastococcus saxobsidens (strain DD2) TaxID=1146883 RepID=H6RRE3_BLASD|nr:AMP-binding protein [Blastococcus saxobsidens]CCG05425.1 Putative fatty-acid--CoA ligase [Blastococcus saxobsidens DD2]